MIQLMSVTATIISDHLLLR